MTVEQITNILNRALHELRQYDPKMEVEMKTNTYHLRESCRHFLGVCGYDGGFIDLDDIVDEDAYYGYEDVVCMMSNEIIDFCSQLEIEHEESEDGRTSFYGRFSDLMSLHHRFFEDIGFEVTKL